MKQKKKQVGGRYLARVRGALGKLKVPQPCKAIGSLEKEQKHCAA